MIILRWNVFIFFLVMACRPRRWGHPMAMWTIDESMVYDRTVLNVSIQFRIAS